MAPFARTTLPANLRASDWKARSDYPAGRPDTFREEYCDLLIAKSAEGLSLTAFAGFIRVSVDTLYEWIKRHRAFADAAARAKPARVLFYEMKLNRSRKGAETTAAIFALRNAAPDEWRDIRSVQHSHDHKIEVLTDAELNAIASGKGHASPQEGPVIDGECAEIVTP